MKTRYLIKYTKESDIKYVAHLELMRTIQRNMRRSELPVEYSKGFNPHIILSIAQPLSVGVYSKGEYMDVEFQKEVCEDVIKEKLNNNAPMGIKFLEVVKVKDKIGDKKAPPAMAAVEAAEYKLILRCTDGKKAGEKLNELLKLKEWNIIKKTKKGEKEVNIRPLIKKIKFSISDNMLNITTLVSCGSKDNLSAQLLGKYIKDNIETIDKEAFIQIERQEIFSYKDGKLVTLSEYFSFSN